MCTASKTDVLPELFSPDRIVRSSKWQVRLSMPLNALRLIDFKKIMDKNWSVFGGALGAVGWKGGRAKSVAWVNRLNDLRRLVMHPLKQYVAGREMSQDDREFLSESRRRVSRLLELAKQETRH